MDTSLDIRPLTGIKGNHGIAEGNLSGAMQSELGERDARDLSKLNVFSFPLFKPQSPSDCLCFSPKRVLKSQWEDDDSRSWFQLTMTLVACHSHMVQELPSYLDTVWGREETPMFPMTSLSTFSSS